MDPDAGANFVNARGQVAGVSYTNSSPNATTGLPTFHQFLWEKGKGMRDLGTLGGTAQNTQNGLNERGQVIGSMTLVGDVLSHPYLWDGEKLIDLGTFGGPAADADAINEAEEIVGWFQYSNFCTNVGGGGHAFLWRHGVMHDLGNLP